MQFRKLMLESARGLAQGVVPLGVDSPDDYRVRAGGVVVPDPTNIDEAMRLRFGDPIGRVLDR